MLMRKAAEDAGSAAVEFAVVLPILILFVTGLLDYGSAVTMSTRLNSAARAGVQYASSHPADNAGIIYAAQHATSDSAMTVGAPALFCTCGSSSAAHVSCTSTCAGTTLRYYVSLSAQETYTPMVVYSGLGSALTLTGAAVMQVQ